LRKVKKKIILQKIIEIVLKKPKPTPPPNPNKQTNKPNHQVDPLSLVF
jgi:hypothetical protein